MFSNCITLLISIYYICYERLNQKQQTSITSDWSDKDKLDTTIYAPVITEYNDEGLITRTFSEGPNSLMNGEVKSFYKNGIIAKSIISKKGKSPITVNFRKVK